MYCIPQINGIEPEPDDFLPFTGMGEDHYIGGVAQKYGLTWFHAIMAGDEVQNMKPAPDIYLAAAEKLGVAPRSCCVIEDSINGVRAAKSAGMRCVAVAQSFAASELQAVSPDYIRPNVSSISLADLGLKEEM